MNHLSTLRLEVDLDKIYHNALTLVTRLRRLGISITGVTKATLGSPEIAGAWLRAGVSGLGDSRIENVERMRAAGTSASMTLIRTPMLSQVDQVVAMTDMSFNTELEVIRKLSAAAKKADRMHGIILMVELGDLREGIMPALLESTVQKTLKLSNVVFMGIGTNLACRSGVSPENRNMAELSALADSIDRSLGPVVTMVSGGNSANLEWAFDGGDLGRVNDLRLGEAMLLGCEPLRRKKIKGLHTNAFTLVAEVIELKNKPSKPWGTLAQAAFGEVFPIRDRGNISQAILAIGRQDTDPEGLIAPHGIKILATSSDHLVVDVSHYKGRIKIGTEISFQLNYSALLRSMTSPFVPVMTKQSKIKNQTSRGPA